MSRRVLVTGGAGFVGSHTVDELLRRGHEVRIFDSLEEQVHGGGVPEYLNREAELVRGDVRDLDALRKAVAGVDVVYHFAAVVGVGQSMYEIARYMGVNSQGTANLLQALLERRGQVEKLIVASSMSIYGEGQYRCAEHGMVTPETRGAAQLRRASVAAGVSGMRTCGGALRDAREQAAAGQLDLRHRQEEPGRDEPAVRPYLRSAGGGAAVFQYLWHAAGAFQPLYGGGGDFCFADAEPACAASV